MGSFAENPLLISIFTALTTGILGLLAYLVTVVEKVWEQQQVAQVYVTKIEMNRTVLQDHENRIRQLEGMECPKQRGKTECGKQ